MLYFIAIVSMKRLTFFQVHQKLCQMSVIFNTFLGYLPLFAETSKLEILYPPTEQLSNGIMLEEESFWI